ncbi:MAG: ferrous iron transport protein A [Anaeroplasmataceae bacterium]
MAKLLSKIPLNQKVKVTKVLGEGKLRRRLFDMGVTPGVNIIIDKVAPLGDPIQIHLRNYELTLRKSEADLVEVVEVFD